MARKSLVVRQVNVETGRYLVGIHPPACILVINSAVKRYLIEWQWIITIRQIKCLQTSMLPCGVDSVAGLYGSKSTLVKFLAIIIKWLKPPKRDKGTKINMVIFCIIKNANKHKLIKTAVALLNPYSLIYSQILNLQLINIVNKILSLYQWSLIPARTPPSMMLINPAQSHQSRTAMYLSDRRTPGDIT